MTKPTHNVIIAAVPGPTQYIARDVTITEKRAPTDDSVRLLREMEDKAKAAVIASVQIADMHFDCVVHMWRDHMSDQLGWRAVFKLNGKQMAAEVYTPNGEQAYAGAFHKLRDEMAQVIAQEVLHEQFVSMVSNAIPRFHTHG